MVGRVVLLEERVSASYRLRHVRRRRTGEETWEIVEVGSETTVIGGLADREEALRIVNGWESLSQRLAT
jgi:hypothetical protein